MRRQVRLTQSRSISFNKASTAVKGQATLVVIANRLSTICNLDIVFVMNEGQMVEQGSYEQLRNAIGSGVSRLVSMQSL